MSRLFQPGKPKRREGELKKKKKGGRGGNNSYHVLIHTGRTPASRFGRKEEKKKKKIPGR